jgi:hypothetical protein
MPSVLYHTIKKTNREKKDKEKGEKIFKTPYTTSRGRGSS